jgi:hypothetical protein
VLRTAVAAMARGRVTELLELGFSLAWQSQGSDEPVGGIPIRMSDPALERLDSVEAQAGALGYRFLGQADGQAMGPQQVTERLPGHW